MQKLKDGVQIRTFSGKGNGWKRFCDVLKIQNELYLETKSGAERIRIPLKDFQYQISRAQETLK